jgi:integrase
MKKTLVQKFQEIDSDGGFPIYIRLRNKNLIGKWEDVSIKTGVSILHKYFSNGLIKTKTPNYTLKQNIVNSLLSDIEKIISEDKKNGFEPNPKRVKQQLENRLKEKTVITPKVNISFWESYDEWYNTKRGKSRGYLKTIITLKNRLKDFEKHRKTRLTFDELVFRTKIFQSNFENFLWDTKGLSNSYINKLYGNLSSFLFHSHQLGYISRKPKIDTLQEVEIDEKIYLRTDEVVKLFNSTKWDYDEKGIDKLSKNKHIYIIEEDLLGKRKDEFGGVSKITNWELIKDLTLFSVSVGCRYSDIPFFKVNDFNFDRKTQLIEWIVQKTDRVNRVPLNDVSGFIFQKYSSGKSLKQNLFPKLSIQKYNKHLKLLLEDLRFNRLVSKPKRVGSKVLNTEEVKLYEVYSSHSNRRSFVKNMIDLGTMDYSTIMKLSGHKTFSQFSKYVSVINEDLLKSKNLYKVNNDEDENSIIQTLNKEFLELDEESRKMVIGIVRGLKK